MLKKLIQVCLLNVFSIAVIDCSNPTQSAFEKIYEEGSWGWIYDEQIGKLRGGSGGGSDPQNALPYLQFLQSFLKQNDIKSVIDVGSGDWRLSKTIDWAGIEYLGIDVVPFLVDYNNRMFGSANIHFALIDGAHDELPSADLLLCKDVLQHLPIEDIQCFLMKLHKYKYAILTNDVYFNPLQTNNGDIAAGGYRPIALTEPPFNLKAEQVLRYQCRGGEVKAVLLWKNNAIDSN